MELLVRGETLPLYQANYRREFIYIDDAVRAIYDFMLDSEPGEVWDVPGEPCEVHDYMRHARQIANNGEIEFIPTPDFHQRIGPTTYVSPPQTRGFERKVKLVQGIRELVAFYKRNAK